MLEAADELEVFFYCLVGGLMIAVPALSIVYTCRAVIRKINASSC